MKFVRDCLRFLRLGTGDIQTINPGVASGSSGVFSSLTVNGTTTLNGTVSASPANANVTISPTGTGTVTINPATAGAINNETLGQTTPLAATATVLRGTTNFQLASTDSSGTPGAATINTPSGRCAIAAAAASVVITSSIVTATSKVFYSINQAATDATLTSILRVQTAAGSFTLTGNAAATAAVVVDFIVVNP